MAHIFKSKELTFAVPEKGSGEYVGCVGGTVYLSTIICPLPCTVTCICTYHTCLCTPHTTHLCTCTDHTFPHCTLGSPTINLTTTTGCTGTETAPTPFENEISQITDAETLKMLNDKLLKSLEEVKARQVELSKAKK